MNTAAGLLGCTERPAGGRELTEARQQADVLEQRYGVRILLSSQCREAAALSSYPIILSDTMDTEES